MCSRGVVSRLAGMRSRLAPAALLALAAADRIGALHRGAATDFSDDLGPRGSQLGSNSGVSRVRLERAVAPNDALQLTRRSASS